MSLKATAPVPKGLFPLLPPPWSFSWKTPRPKTHTLSLQSGTYSIMHKSSQTTRIWSCRHTNLDGHEYKHMTITTYSRSHPDLAAHSPSPSTHRKSHTHGYTHLRSHTSPFPSLSEMSSVPSPRAQRVILRQVSPASPKVSLVRWPQESSPSLLTHQLTGGDAEAWLCQRGYSVNKEVMRLTNIPHLPIGDPDAACPGPLIIGQGGASEQRQRHRDSQGAIHTHSDLHRTPKDPGTGLVWHSPFGTSPAGRGAPSPGMSHSPKPGLTFQSVWLDPSLPSSHPPSNESRQETDLRAPEAKTCTCQFLLLSVNPAFCWTFIHSVSVFHLFVCSLIHFQPRRMLNKSLLSG